MPPRYLESKAIRHSLLGRILAPPQPMPPKLQLRANLNISLAFRTICLLCSFLGHSSWSLLPLLYNPAQWRVPVLRLRLAEIRWYLAGLLPEMGLMDCS